MRRPGDATGQTRTATVQSGQRTMVDFTTQQGNQNPNPQKGQQNQEENNLLPK